MTPETWQKIKGILEQAVDMTPVEAADFLDKACAGDVRLRSEVESMLNFDRESVDLLEQNAVSAVFTDVENTASLIGTIVGNYKLISELGVGGMGAVYLAERSDGEFTQRVALKLIKRGMDSAAVLRRFITERQILATLEHPNIARLIDGGTTDDGLPFFVMEYVDGRTVTEYAAAEDIDLNARLGIFLKVCAAVTFAHQNLVIHRDLKPSNIVVTADGTPKLLDFGIAKMLKDDSGAETATRNFIFTPEYASPEQVRGETLTTSTDIYSLGAILYELLTGNRPYRSDSKNISEIIRAVCETQPERPSLVGQSKRTRPQALRGDLDNIVLRSLRKEPERRYSSVEQFADDIRRHLAGLPVTATADTWGYRFSKFVGRNRIAAAAAVLILITLVGGLAATVYQANKAQRRFNDVRQLANSFLFEFHDAIETLPGSTPARELVVKRAVEYLDKLAAESGNDPQLQRELAAAFNKIGQIQGNSYFSNLGDTDGATKSYQRSLELRARLAAADPKNFEFQHELAETYEGVGDMLYTLNDLNGGLRSYETAIEIRERLAAAAPDVLKYRLALAGVLGKRGDIKGMEGFPNLGDTPGALESYRQDVAIYEGLLQADPENREYQLGYGTTLQFYGMLQTVTGDAKGAIASGERSTSIIEKLIAAEPNNTKFETHLMSGLAFMRFPLLEEGRFAEAVEDARRVIRSMEKMSAADPKNVFAKRSLSVSYNGLGVSLLRSGDARGAIDSHRRSLAMAVELLAAAPENVEALRDVSITRQFLAEAQVGAGDFDAALIGLRQSLAFIETEIAAENPDVQTKDDFALCLTNIGKALAAKNDLAGAAAAFRRAMPVAEEVMQKTPFSVRFKTRHAASFFEAGKAIARLAKTQSGAESETLHRESCSYLNRSLGLWTAMRDAGTLAQTHTDRPEAVQKELNGCSQ